MQKPVITEQSATRRPCGRLLRPRPPRGQVKNRTSAGTLGKSTSEPSAASTRKRRFQSIWGPNRFSYRTTRRSQRIRQNRSFSRPRASQKASSVTFSARIGARERTQLQACNKPWVIEAECRATSIMSQETTSGVRIRLRRGKQPASWAAIRNSRAGRMAWKALNPEVSTRPAARTSVEPIENIRASMQLADGWRSSMTTFGNPSIGQRRLLLLGNRAGLA
jgi:hypothetical protein